MVLDVRVLVKQWPVVGLHGHRACSRFLNGDLGLPAVLAGFGWKSLSFDLDLLVLVLLRLVAGSSGSVEATDGGGRGRRRGRHRLTAWRSGGVSKLGRCCLPPCFTVGWRGICLTAVVEARVQFSGLHLVSDLRHGLACGGLEVAGTGDAGGRLAECGGAAGCWCSSEIV
ncbi:hypothetical protein RHMOL_Rhmol07G0174900 [Rhododendron molle]|uniref:Uncharacterized protein n=1 Tax=Rhododendron molle TaxID=49168 RepID=A0ACC0N3S3_RHOML|nr:hypothetical protein RHMOL_Rhmol07G0174900 [Rhododendron molle]